MRAWRRWLRAGSVGLIPLVLAVDFSACSRRVPLSNLTEDPTANTGLHRRLGRGSPSPGSHVALLLRDGTRLEGRYRGVERIPPDVYLARAKSLLASSKLRPPPPAPGTMLAVLTRRGRTYPARLVSYGLRSLELERPGKRHPEFVLFTDLESVSDEGSASWTVETLEAEAEAGRLPVFAEVVVEPGGSPVRVPAENVAEVSFITSTGEVVTGALVIGVLAGILVVVAAASAMSYSSGDCSNVDIAYP